MLVILVSPDGDVQNRIIHTQVHFTQSQLLEAANFLNAHYSGLTMEAVRERLKTDILILGSGGAGLFAALVTPPRPADPNSISLEVGHGCHAPRC